MAWVWRGLTEEVAIELSLISPDSGRVAAEQPNWSRLIGIPWKAARVPCYEPCVSDGVSPNAYLPNRTLLLINRTNEGPIGSTLQTDDLAGSSRTSGRKMAAIARAAELKLAHLSESVILLTDEILNWNSLRHCPVLSQRLLKGQLDCVKHRRRRTTTLDGV